MHINIHSMKEAETRLRGSLFTALNSALIIYLALVTIVGLGLVIFAR